MAKKFLRRTWNRYSKLGKGKKKKQKWKRPTGRDNKIREKRKGYPARVSLGYKKEKSSREKIQNKKPITVYNLKDLEKIKKDEIVIIGNIGKKKKIEVAKKAQEKKIPVYNLNLKKFLKNKNKPKKQEKTKTETKESKKQEKKK